MESRRSSRTEAWKARRQVCKRCGPRLVGKVFPEHCTTILKATLQKICAWPWKVLGQSRYS